MESPSHFLFPLFFRLFDAAQWHFKQMNREKLAHGFLCIHESLMTRRNLIKLNLGWGGKCLFNETSRLVVRILSVLSWS